MSNLPQQFQDRVKDRMKEVIGDLIPEADWQKMVDATIKEFLADDLPKLVKAELQADFAKKIAAELSKNEWAGWVSPNGQWTASAAVAEITKQVAPDLVHAMFSGIIQSSVYQMQNSIRNSSAPRY